MASKYKEHDYKKMEKDLAHGVFDECNVILLQGHENYLVRSYEKKICDLYVEPAANELDYIELSDEKLDVDEIISHSDTLPMISAKRVVTVRNHPGLMSASDSSRPGENRVSPISDEDIRRLIEYLDMIPQTTILIFMNEKINGNKLLSKKISKIGKTYDFGRLNRKDVSSFIKKKFRAEKKEADEYVVNEIINTTGYFDRDSDYDLSRLMGDVVKISSFSNDEKIKVSDVSNVLSTSLETDVFALLDSISQINKNDAILLVNNLMEVGENSFRLLGAMISQFELILGIKEFTLRDMNKSEIMKRMGIKSDYRYKKISDYAERFTVDKLYDIIMKLYGVEKNIKNGIYGERLAMIMFIAEL